MRLQPGPNDPSADLVYTPPELAAKLVAHLKPSGRVLDPAKGQGAFYDTFPVGCSRAYCEISEGRDFFEWTEPVDWIITNPPWSKIRQFISQGCKVANHVCYLITANHLFTKARLKVVRDAGFGVREIIFVPTPKSPWPQSGFAVAMIHLERSWQGDTKFLWLD